MPDALAPETIVNNFEYKQWRENLLSAIHRHTGVTVRYRTKPYVREDEGGEGAGDMLPHPYLLEKPDGITDEDPYQIINPAESEDAKELANELRQAMKLGFRASAAPKPRLL